MILGFLFDCFEFFCCRTGLSSVQLFHHQLTCLYQLIPCPYSIYGCLDLCIRGELPLHVAQHASKHLLLANSRLFELASILHECNAYRRRPMGLHPFETPDLTDSELIAVLSQILLEHGM